MGEVDPYDHGIHSFIVRIWLEETVAETGQTVWRGHITHVPSGVRRYFDDLDTIKRTIMPYLRSADVAASDE